VNAVGALAQEQPVPGRIPGTERWIVWLRDRSFDLRQELQQIRAARTARLAQLDAMAAADQREFLPLAVGAALIHSDVGMQTAVLASPVRLTNGLHVGLGGGL
jgi:hypothetical protein